MAGMVVTPSATYIPARGGEAYRTSARKPHAGRSVIGDRHLQNVLVDQPVFGLQSTAHESLKS